MRKILLTVLPLFVFFTAFGQHTAWPELSQTEKPWTRWWWMGNAVDSANIRRELQEFATAGIGGVEITPIYGVVGEEEHFIEYLSPEFTAMLNFTIAEANKLRLGVDLPPGSGWRCGGPFVPREKGLWNLRIKKFGIKAGESWKLPPDLENVAAVSFVSENGTSKIIQATSVQKLEQAGTIYVALREKSGDKVKRASDGGKGWAIDTFNKEITDWYLSEFWKSLGIDEGKIRCFFHDSFEYTGDFTTHFMDEFKRRRGYDLTAYLHVLAGDCENQETVARVKSDYRETLSDLVLESFIQPMTEWANAHNSLNRNQAHGSPGNILDLYAACDIPETEIFRTVDPGTVDIFVNKFASSAAHVTGKKLVSSESFTWLNEHWTVTTSDMRRATNRLLLAGINHIFFHGTCYSPEDAQWPGWLFYASTQVNNRNPLWAEMPTLFGFIGRAQQILQNSTPQNDVLVYWPYHDVAAAEGRIFNHIGVNKDAGWFWQEPISGLSQKLMDAGCAFDYVSDRQLLECETANGEIITSGQAKYKAVVVPKTKYIPIETIEKLRQFIANGGKVYFDGDLPESVPGMNELEKRESRLAEIKNSISPEKWVGDILGLLERDDIEGEKSLAKKGFHYLKMKKDTEDWYAIFNTSTEAIDEEVVLNSPAHSFLFWNPMTGKTSKARSHGNSIRLQLEPEEMMFVQGLGDDNSTPFALYEEQDSLATKIGALWKLEFREGGPVFPGNLQTDVLLSWTEMGDMETRRFSGTARYSTEFNWTGNSDNALLDLGDVRDCAHVKLNGKDYGALVGPTYKVQVDNLKKGNNILQIEVTNVAANRIRDLDIRGVEWRKFHDINLVNIDYKPFDASGWPVRDAGLLGPVTLRPL